jgi:hypothetical protein
MTYIHDATKPLSIRKQLRRNTAMYVYTGELLGQPSPKSAVPGLPDWARLYLKSVRAGSLKSLTPYVSLFETITFHPLPLMSNSPLLKVHDKLIEENSAFLPMFLSELGRIRDARLFQNKNFEQLHANHRKLFQDVVTSFKTFEPKDLVDLLAEGGVLIDLTFSGTGFFKDMPLWNLGKRFVQEKLPERLSTRVTKSARYMQDAIFARLAVDLISMVRKRNVDIKRNVRAKRP